MNTEIGSEWNNLYHDKKKMKLFIQQKELLDTFLSHGAISKEQHDHSLSCLITKMGIKDVPKN